MQGGIKSKSSGSGKKESDPDPQPGLPLLGSYLAYCGCEMMSGINIHTVPTGKTIYCALTNDWRDYRRYLPIAG